MKSIFFTHLSKSIEIIKSYPKLLIFFSLLSMAYYGVYLRNEMLKAIFFASFVVSGLLIMPIAFGKYTEILNGKDQLSLLDIFKKHWLNFYSVVIVLSLPATFFSFANLEGIEIGVDVLINALSIFIIPLVFILQKGFSTIPLGLKCLKLNFNGTFILILLTTITFLLKHLFEKYGMTIFDGSLFYSSTFGFILNFTLTIVDLFVFVIASLILKKEFFDTELETFKS